jgi:eukaryotic-like serine/threonine-protein kinase
VDESKAQEGRPIVGDVIAGRYRIESVAGEGGMGIVYEAEHVVLGQRVALKALLPGVVTSAEAVERFSREASAIARITSEHVVRVMDAGCLPGGAPYIVMEFLDGADLGKTLARRGALPAAEVVDFALQALEALAHAHAAHVIHRDLKPANLFLARNPDGRHVIKLVDFGISQTIDLSSDDGRMIGSPAYMSPEQLRSQPVDLRTDLWSLGVVLYELLSGAPPFAGTFSELVTAILEADAPPLTASGHDIPPRLSQIVARCLSREPSARWSNTADLATALAPFGSGRWSGALERIERALANMAPLRTPRRFDTLENALQALEAPDVHRRDELETSPPPAERVVSARAKVSSAETFGDTIPAPPSAARVVVVPSGATTLHSFSARPALRIVLVDDSELTLLVHAEVLTRSGFEVRTALSVGEFDALVDSWKPHLVLMDVLMPAMNGDALCLRVKERFRATLPVVLVSDLPHDELAARAKTAKADAFFSKTSGSAALVELVRDIFAMMYSPEDLP